MCTQEHGDAQTIGVLIPPSFCFPAGQSSRENYYIFYAAAATDDPSFTVFSSDKGQC